MRRPLAGWVAGLLLAWPALGQHPAAPAPAALEPATTGGVEAVDRALAKLATHRRLLVVGAHPDDEDNTLLALVARHLGGEAAYLSLSRGEGGQNLIGPELGVDLGVVRTGELLAARRVEGSRQYFARAFDFGYTRSLEETFARWPREALLEDAVRVVRRFKPQVIVAIFPPDERARHGQHQASAVVAGDLFEAAGGEDRFPRLTAAGLPPWQPQALYRRVWWAEQEATLFYELGLLDPFSGRSMLQLGAASRSLHRSQDMGAVQPVGPRRAGLAWVAGGAGSGSDRPFAGVDTRLAAIAAHLPAGEARAAIGARLEEVERLAGGARAALAPADPGVAVPALARIVARLREALDLAAAAGGSGLVARDLLAEKLAVAEAGLAAAASVMLDAVADAETLAEGEHLEVTAQAWNASGGPVELAALSLRGAPGWAIGPAPEADAPADTPPRPGLEERRFVVTAAAGLAPTLPYYLERPRQGDLYDWSEAPAAVRGEPDRPPPLVAHFELRVAGEPVALEREVVHRYRDQAIGEVRRPLRAVPRLEVGVVPDLLAWPLSRSEPRRLEVTLSSNVNEPLHGHLEIELPGGWGPRGPLPFAIDEPRGRAVLEVLVERPGTVAAGVVHGAVAAVLADGARFDRAFPVLDHPHIRPAPTRAEARFEVRSLDLALPAVERVGYVRGASDRLPELLAEVGLPVELVGARELFNGDLSRFRILVVGARAYEAEPALAKANKRLLDWARAGGTLVVQYQQYPFVDGGFAPSALTIGRPHGRVTDEASPVRVLAPEHPVLRAPNAIDEADWQGWVQERGLYFAETWDDAWTPLLELQDPGQPPQRGALLVAPLGEGAYVYTGLAFFRQLPAGVPGAFRLFMNLLAVGT